MSVTVDTHALTENYRALRKAVGKIYCVLKCNAYGHGAVRCAKALYEAGARRFAVFSLSEALAVKPYVGESELLILGRTDPGELRYVTENRLTQTVSSEEYACAILSLSKRPDLHVEVDVGMNRAGFSPFGERLFSAVERLKGSVKGIYTHFPRADSADIADTERRLSVFLKVAHESEQLLNSPLIKHSAASASAVRLPSARLDASRIGIMLYGVMPSNTFLPGLTPVMSLHGRITELRTARVGEAVGYGYAFLCKRNSVIATADVGYACGVRRSLAGKISPSINGFTYPLIAVCMDRCMIDVTDALTRGETVKVGDRVTFFGGNPSVTDVARAADTISYEILTGAGLKRTDLV